jgi:formylglycine-generating enzyme required for sulfatase activity
MGARIFISYRRDDTAGDARSVYQRMQRTFGSRRLFMDVDSIQRGRDFHDVLDDHLKKSAVMLVVIGPRWLDARDADGNRRLDDLDDFIRLEVARALKRDIAVIPLLVGGARVPRAADLPDALRGLTRRQGITVTHQNFPSDMDALEKDIRTLLRRAKLRSLAAVSSVALAVTLFALAYYLGAFSIWSSKQTASERHTLTKTANRQADLAEQQRPEHEAKKSTLRITPSFNQLLTGAEERGIRPGQEFQECTTCPRMIVVPAGNYLMGSTPTEVDRAATESPRHMVVMAKPFAVGKYEVTRDQYGTFVQETNRTAAQTCSDYDVGKDTEVEQKGWSFRFPGYPQDGDHPVVCVTWQDAKDYAAWLTRKLGKTYRLLSEAEWEYAARAGSQTRYHFGEDEKRLCEFGNVADSTDPAKLSSRPLSECRDGYSRTAPVGKFAANGFGLHDTIGNVYEWVEDCANSNYEGAPSDGSAWLVGNCSKRVARGGSWGSPARNNRSAVRALRFGTEARFHFIGFRVARSLAPKPVR